MMSSISAQPHVQSSFVPQHNTAETKQQPAADKEETEKDSSVKSEDPKLTPLSSQKLSPKDLKQIQQLKSRDLEVKAHEQAHLSAAGSLAMSGASFTYQTGPNGVRYAVGGEVSISTSSVAGDPAATLRKADAIRRAALAPANPSSQDQIVAGKATSMAQKASADLIKLTQEEAKETKADRMGEDNNDEKQLESSDELDSDSVEPTQGSVPGSLLDISV